MQLIMSSSSERDITDITKSVVVVVDVIEVVS